MICYFYDTPTYLFFGQNLPELLYYSYISVALIILVVGLFVFINARHRLLNKLFLILTVSFSLWTLISLISWTNINSSFIMFIWPFLAILAALLFIFSIYFIYVFLNKNEDVSIKIKLLFLLLLSPVLLLAHTNLSVSGFNLIVCNTSFYEGLIFKIYYIILGYLAMIWIGVLLIQKYKTATTKLKKQIVFIGVSVELFLFMLSSIIFLITYLGGKEFLSNSNLELYALFGATISMVTIGVLIMRPKTFSVGALTINILVIVLVILVASQYAYAETKAGFMLVSITLFMTAAAGWILAKNVKKEIKQRKEIEKLVKQLKKANGRLKILDKVKSEFVSIASHQLRSPITSIRGYASMLLEGVYGKFPNKAQQALKNILDSSKYMAILIEDYLNVSRIEAGNMKYELSDFNLKDEVLKISDEMRRAAMEKGLVLIYRSDCAGTAMVHADIGKMRQIIMNLIDNSIKYTPKGTVTIVIHDDLKKKKIRLTVQDTGVGMDKEDTEEIFDKFIRAKNANEINVTGAGLGLFIAKKMVIEMKGKIWTESEGEGKGSSFNIEFPMLSGKANPNK